MRTRSVAGNSALALAGDVAAKAGVAGVTVLAARALPTAQFAVLATCLAAATILTAALDAGSQTLLTRDGVTSPAARAALLRALLLARGPFAALAVAGAAVVGVAMRRPVEALLTVLVGLLGALQLSLTGVVRAAGDLRPEAVLKLAVGVLSPPAAAVALLAGGTAVAALTGLAIANALALAAVRRPLARTVGRGDRVSPGAALRRAIPLGAIALATLAYYRSGTLALALLGRPAQTAVFATASTVAFGLLMAGNAVTTALLPRLAAARDAADLAAVTRRALACATGIGVVLAAGAAGLADPIVTVAFGSRYAGAAAPLSLLALATAFIAPAGVLGTALIAAGRLRPVALQVGLSLVVNVSALALLVPAFGAVGAAAATVACETVALLTLALAAVRALPGLLPALSRPRLAPPSIARRAR